MAPNGNGNDIWEAPVEVRELMLDIISKAPDLAPLAACDTKIALIMKAKAVKRGGQVVLGKAGKAPKILEVLGKGDYKFILEIAADEWTGLDNVQKRGLLDHLLCCCGVEEDEETHELKFSIKAPEVSYFFEEIKRNGDWRPRPPEEESAAVTTTLEDAAGTTP